MRFRWFGAGLLVLLIGAALAGCSLVAGEMPPPSPESPTIEAPAGGTLIVDIVTEPAGQPGAFQFTGVPTGTVAAGGTLVVADLQPGTYTTTQVDPAPDFDVTGIACDDSESATPSSGDPQTRTAVMNVEAGETIRCTFTNTQRGSVVIISQTTPDGASGGLQFTGVPTGTIPADGTLVAANLQPGTYTSTQVDPAPDFDVTAVSCDDGNSATPSSGDPQTRTAVFNVDAGEMVRCTFTNTRRGAAVIVAQTAPDGAPGSFQFTGVPTGTVSGGGTLVVADLPPGTYTSTQVDPAPDYELTDVACDDGDSATPSSGDPGTRSAIFNIDPGETVRCSFVNTSAGATVTPTVGGGSTSGAGGGSAVPGGGTPAGARNPFTDPASLVDYPLPDDLPPDAGTYAAPKPGPWSVVHYAGRMDCGVTTLTIPASPPERGILEVQDGGRTLVGTGLQEGTTGIVLNADPEIAGRYSGAVQATEQGVPVMITYYWQLITDEHIVGFLTAAVTSEGVTCNVYRSFEMTFAG